MSADLKAVPPALAVQRSEAAAGSGRHSHWQACSHPRASDHHPHISMADRFIVLLVHSRAVSMVRASSRCTLKVATPAAHIIMKPFIICILTTAVRLPRVSLSCQATAARPISPSRQHGSFQRQHTSATPINPHMSSSWPCQHSCLQCRCCGQHPFRCAKRRTVSKYVSGWHSPPPDVQASGSHHMPQH
jgi:hypothetical protein